MSFFSVYKYTTRNTPRIQVPYYFFRGLIFFFLKNIFPDGYFELKTFNKKKIKLFKRNSFSSAFTYAKIPESEDVLFLRNFASKNKTVFLDIGANIGAYSIMLIDKCKSVYSFEPHPETFKYLQINNSINNEECTLVNSALGSKVGSSYMTNGVSETNKIVETAKDDLLPISVTTLDLFAKDNLNLLDEILLKIDVEGYEEDVLQGAQTFFENYTIKAMVIETDNARFENMKNWLKKKGYTVNYAANSNNLRAYK